MKTSRWNWGLAGMGLLAAICLGTSGCQSFNGPPPGNLTSVTITNHPLADVQSAVAGVFATHGFTGGQTGPNEFTYTRLGSRMNDIAYGSSLFQETVTVKVVVTTEPQLPDSIVVGCNAWLVEAEDDPMFADSHKVRSLRKWPYEQLLEDIKAQLGE
jgi:hypothetical protein